MFFILLLVVYVCVSNAFNSIAVTNQTILKVKIQSEGNMNSAEIQQQEVLQQESILSTMHIQLQLTLSIFLIWSIFSSWRPTCNQKDWQTSRYFRGVSKVTIRNADTGRWTLTCLKFKSASFSASFRGNVIINDSWRFRIVLFTGYKMHQGSLR